MVDLDFMCDYSRSQCSAGRAPYTGMDVVHFDSSLPDSVLDNHSRQVFQAWFWIDSSLRVNLDLGKTAYAWQIEHDKDVAGTVVRTSTIPEELGRIEYLFTDKTGTITKNGTSPL